MRKNRKMSKRMSVVAANSARFGAIIALFCAMTVVYVLSSSSCSQLMDEKGRMERTLAKLEESHRRESMRWEEMKTPERIRAALARHGLKMDMPSSAQQIRLNAAGAPYPNQVSIARLRQRSAAAMARLSPAPSRTRQARGVR